MAGIGKVMDEVKKAVVGKDAVLLRAVLSCDGPHWTYRPHRPQRSYRSQRPYRPDRA